MNAKKNKNKQKQKPAPPKVESDAQIDKENVVEVPKEEITSVKVEERVPEIVSEVVTQAEPKVAESDTPKKPKRNRGKKKKTDKEDDGDDEQEQKPDNFEAKRTSEIKEEKVESTIETPSVNAPDVTPAARKKKNKNKKQSEPTTEKSEQEIKITSIKSAEELTDVKIVTLVPVTTETEESKTKKKNKKKKRTDSERSDKAEEIVSCTAAFQKLLEAKDDKKVDSKVDQKEIKVEDKSQTEVKEAIKEEENKPIKETIIEAVEPEPTKADISTIPLKEESGKSKKKNKKDKKVPPKPEDESQKPVEIKSEFASQEPTESSSEIKPTESVTPKTDDNDNKTLEKLIEIPKAAPKIQPIITKEQTEVSTEKPSIEKEKSPKPKAKIAKPVEKKRKGKANTSSTEDLLEEVESELPALKQEEYPKQDQKPPSQDLPKEVEDKPKEETQVRTENKAITATTKTKLEIKEDSITAIQEKETIPLPEGGMGKKRRKSPKPKPKEHTEVKKLDIQSEPAADAKKVEELKTAVEEKADVITPQIEAPKPILTVAEIPKKEVPKVEPTKADEPQKVFAQPNIPIPLGFGTDTLAEPRTTKILQTPDIDKMTEKQKENVLQEVKETEKIPVPEIEGGKKRKKSPKLPRKLAKTPEPVEKPSQFIEDIPQIPPPPPFPKDFLEDIKEKPSTARLPPLEDIEIRSVKASESEGSSCDIVPDVHYPRASSQLLDTNNNTVIQEVTTTDTKLDILTVLSDTPFIQGSGATPSITPEFLPTIKLTETEPSSSKTVGKDTKVLEKETHKDKKDNKNKKSEEKTDLKSKVLDVNQGMEELRKSIERSLAELSAIERNEKDAEDQFAKAQLKLEEITAMASKKTEESRKDVKASPSTKTEFQKKDEPIISEKDTKEVKQEIKQDLPTASTQEEPKATEQQAAEKSISPTPPVCPARKDNKGKGKKKKGKHDTEQSATPAPSSTSTTESSATARTTGSIESKETTQDTKKEDKTEQKTETSQEKGKQQSAIFDDDNTKSDTKETDTDSLQIDFQPIENFEDAMTSSNDDVNKTFEMIANEPMEGEQLNPEINITAPSEEDEKGDTKNQEKVNPVSQPKNLLGHPDIPARLNKTDYKKEKNKTPNTRQAKVKIKDAVTVEVTKESKEVQTENKRRFFKDKSVTEAISSVVNENEEYVYKYSFRKVFLPSACHVCKKDLKQMRVPCSFCNLIFYCSPKHKDEDYAQHQALCFAVSTIVHLKNQKHIYADAQNITGQDYRLLRMQMIVSCEKVLKRRLLPWEQEALLYPRICADPSCREWRQGKLKNCEGCGQVSYCSDEPHLPKTHQRWCKSYSLYHKLVVYQQTKGRLEPKLPSRVMADLYLMPEKLNEVLASMYEEKIDMTDIQYAALTQIATAPLTAAYCQQIYTSNMNCFNANGVQKKSSFTIHVVGAELQFEADALNKWEVFFLHLRPDVKDLKVVLVGPDLNPSKLPLDLLGKIKLCENCQQNKRRVTFDFQDNKSYYEYWSTEFSTPDLVCAFNPSIQRSSVFNGKDTWPATIKCILKLKVPFIVTSHTMTELQRDLIRIKECANPDVDLRTISDAKFNAFASVRPDRNFISDDEMPLLFKNFCFAIVCGSF